MPITIATVGIKYKDPSSGEYVPVNAVNGTVDSSLTVSGASADAKVAGDFRSEIVQNKKYESHNLLFPVNMENKTVKNVSFTWTGYKVKFLNTCSGSGNYDLYNNSTQLPDGIVIGGTYHVIYSSDHMPFVVQSLDSNGTATTLVNKRSNTSFTVPNDAVGMIMRFKLQSGIAYNETVQLPFVYGDSSNISLKEDSDTADLHNYVVPSYYTSHIATKADSINEIGASLPKQSARFFFVTDSHINKNANHSPALVNELIKQTGIRNIAFGGDAIQDKDTKVLAFEEIIKFIRYWNHMDGIANVFYNTGNHEYNNQSDSESYRSRQLSMGTIAQLFNAKNASKITQIEDSNSFYYDDNTAKIRFYFIDCDVAATITIDTCKNVLATLSSVPSGYAVLLISHAGLNLQGTSIITRMGWIMSVCAAMNDGSSVTITYGTSDTVTYNFSGNARTFIGALTGHIHLDSYVYYDTRFPVISTTCDAYDAQSTVTRTLGDTSEQAFDVVQIDVPSKRIYLTRIGSGNDRTFSFGDSNSGLVT